MMDKTRSRNAQNSLRYVLVNRLSLFFKEPLVHFALAGGLLFVVFQYIGAPQPVDLSATADPIVVGTREVEHLKDTWTQLWDRPPTRAELTRLVDDFIREEALYREAIALQLDQDDLIVRRRMAQKMAFLSNDTETVSLSEDALLGWFEENKMLYESPATVSFSHIYFNPDQRGGQAENDARSLLALLDESDSPQQQMSQQGDPFISRYDFMNIGRVDLTNLFGEEFTKDVFKLESQTWLGPVRSSYGFHLVFVAERQARRVPKFEEVRSLVESDWMQEAARNASRRQVLALVAKHGLEIDPKLAPIIDIDACTGGQQE